MLVNLKPTGEHYMEDFHRAGGMPALLRQLRPLLRLHAATVNGMTLGEQIDAAPPEFDQDVIHPLDRPIHAQGGIVVLRGNLAPGGAILKQAAADQRLMEHEGRAVVFEGLDDLSRRNRRPRPGCRL